MNALLQDYLPLAIFIGVALGLGAVLLITPFLVAYKSPDPEKLSAHECGFNAFHDAPMKFDVRFCLGAHRLADVDDVWSRLLRGRDDADVDAALRRRALRLCAARLAAAVRRDDRRRNADQQNGPGAAQGLRPDAGAALRHLDGLVRQWRRLLPLFLFGGARLRPHRAGRHLPAGLTTDRRGSSLLRPATAKEDQAAPSVLALGEHGLASGINR